MGLEMPFQEMWRGAGHSDNFLGALADGVQRLWKWPAGPWCLSSKWTLLFGPYLSGLCQGRYLCVIFMEAAFVGYFYGRCLTNLNLSDSPQQPDEVGAVIRSS